MANPTNFNLYITINHKKVRWSFVASTNVASFYVARRNVAVTSFLTMSRDIMSPVHNSSINDVFVAAYNVAT